MISIGIHLAVLLFLGVVEFSDSNSQGVPQAAPTAKVERRKKVTEAALSIPKPKVKKPSAAGFAKGPDISLPMVQGSGASEPGSNGVVSRSGLQAGQRLLPSRRAADLSARITTFGSFAEDRRVCYLVDCSGSMRGLSGLVRERLTDSIQSLQPDQYFCVVCFGGDSLFEMDGGRLVRATTKAKSKAQDFINSMQPAGQTNALKALEKALQVRDGLGNGPSVVCVFTDGFELTTEDEQKFLQEVADLRKRFAPATRINTVGFCPQSADRRMLEAIARRSLGEFVLVEHDA
jgi:hypothetical protein